MTAAPPLDRDQRDRIVAALSDRPAGIRLLARLVVLHSVPLRQALDARVSDLDARARTLTLTDKRNAGCVVALDDATVELAVAATAERAPDEPLLAGRGGHQMGAEPARGALLGAARRAGVPVDLAQLRPQALIAA